MAKNVKRGKSKLAKAANRGLILAGIARRAFASRNKRAYDRKVKHPAKRED